MVAFILIQMVRPSAKYSYKHKKASHKWRYYARNLMRKGDLN